MTSDAPKMTTASKLPTWGALVCKLVCRRCNRQDMGEVRRDGDGREWLAVTSHRWRAGIIARAPEDLGRRPDLFDMHDLATTTAADAWCRKCSTWAAVDLDATRDAARTAVPTRPTKIPVLVDPA